MSDVTVRKKKNGKWEVRWRDTSGRRKGRTIDRRGDADRFATEIRRQQQVGDLVDLQRGTIGLSDFVEVYWRDYAIPNLATRRATSTRTCGTNTYDPASAGSLCVSSRRLC